MSLIAEQELMAEDIKYSAQMEVAKFLGTGQFEIIQVSQV